MVLDNGEDVIPRQGHGDCFALDEDQASLSLHSDEETDTDSVMMVSSYNMLIQSHIILNIWY